MPRKLARHLTWLEAFVAAVETGSLEAAAQHLGVARSVVSEHLRALEETLAEGEALVERGPGRRLRLTPRGERLFAGAQASFHQLDLKRLRDLAAPEPGLRLGLSPTLSDALMEPLAKAAATEDLKLEAAFGGAHELVRQIQTRELDLALGFTPLPPHRGVEYRVLARLPFVVLAAPACGLPKAAPFLRVKDLADRPFVDWLRDDPYGGANSARFLAAGIQVRESARVESFLQLYPALRAFGACAIAPDLRALAPFPADVVTWPLKERKAQVVEVVALWPSGGASPAAETCLKALAAHLRKRR
ncbi:LysR family transcriptional regulator [Geothrix sp. PMB-07]|uniref:LysR substrate-binding domain-containing protein n=1 Tax=Geothrix sp. PMB-07 TaxID=3068640 RepID=UPI002741D1AC|nr:LysR family transcriptional regulator [Geothrix sp. PMB-07]WLT30186.1 LysR family transcriptional regulator [Geothrix sp. PMB-07]